MTTIHMETEKIRSLIQRMRASTSMLDAQSDHLNMQARLLRNAWEGGRAQDFHNDMRHLIRQMDDHIRSLEILAARAQKEVDAWEAVDRECSFGRWHDLRAWPMFTKARLETVRDIRDIATGVGLILTALHTTMRGGEIIFSGKNLYRRFADLPKNLRHVSPENFAKGLGKNSVGWLNAAIGFLDFAEKGIKNFAHYEDGSDRTAALSYDAAFVIAKTVLTPVVQKVVLTTVGAVSLGTLATAGAPAVVVVGAGATLWWGSGFLFGEGADALYGFVEDNTEIKDAVVQQGGDALDLAISAGQNATRAGDSAFRGVVNSISSGFR